MARTRAQIHEGRKIALRYRDEHGRDSERTVWPIAVGYLEAVRLLAAWCELRNDFRSFRTDRVVEADYLGEKYPERRDVLRARWRQKPGLGTAGRYLTGHCARDDVAVIGVAVYSALKRHHGEQNRSRLRCWRACARPAAPAVAIRRTGRASPPRMMPRSISFRHSFVNDRLSGMRCEGDRCSALSGKIGVATHCGIYAVRPEVCRTCMPGDPECQMARQRHGLPALA